jgi:hypothetical protein
MRKSAKQKAQNCTTLHLAHKRYRCVKYFALKVFIRDLLTMLSRCRITQRERRLGLMSNELVRKRKESVMP